MANSLATDPETGFRLASVSLVCRYYLCQREQEEKPYMVAHGAVGCFLAEHIQEAADSKTHTRGARPRT